MQNIAYNKGGRVEAHHGLPNGLCAYWLTIGTKEIHWQCGRSQHGQTALRNIG